MKKKLSNKKILVIIIIGIILSGITYVAAQTLIDSKDVIYTDKSELNASNVQDAIDGTCSKIDTRLSAIEDKLYTVENIFVTSNFAPTTADLTYTGVYVTVPANSYCSLLGQVAYYSHIPYRVSLNSSATALNAALSFSDYGTQGAASSLSTTYSFYTTTVRTIYLWVKYELRQNPSSKTEVVSISGFCATKYKN